FVFSMISYGSQLPGGIFLPILTLGAILGAVYCALMVRLGLMPIRYLPNFIIYAMAGYFACISKAPFTAILLITEMVGSLAHLMPLALVAVVAYLVVDILHGEPVYTAMFNAFIGNNPQQRKHKEDVTMPITIYAGAQLDGCQVKDYHWPADTIVMVVCRGEEKIIPNGQTKLLAGDTLILRVNSAATRQVYYKVTRAAHYAQG
ncbi:chloride channel protein, partial [uncultured Limosilactobacillus sp.]